MILAVVGLGLMMIAGTLVKNLRVCDWLDPFILGLPSRDCGTLMSQKLSKLMNIIILGTAVGVCVLVCAAVASVDKHHQEVCCYMYLSRYCPLINRSPNN